MNCLRSARFSWAADALTAGGFGVVFAEKEEAGAPMVRRGQTSGFRSILFPDQRP
jgi:hypothetical protein